MNLYRVAHVYRANPEASPQEKVLMVAADSEEVAAAHVNAKLGHEVTGVTRLNSSIEVADQKPPLWMWDVEKGSISLADQEPSPIAPPKPFAVPTLKKRPTLADMDAEENG